MVGSHVNIAVSDSTSSDDSQIVFVTFSPASCIIVKSEQLLSRMNAVLYPSHSLILIVNVLSIPTISSAILSPIVFCFSIFIYLFVNYLLIAIAFRLAFVDVYSVLLFFMAFKGLSSHAMNFTDCSCTALSDPACCCDNKLKQLGVTGGGHCCPRPFKGYVVFHAHQIGLCPQTEFGFCLLHSSWNADPSSPISSRVGWFGSSETLRIR